MTQSAAILAVLALASVAPTLAPPAVHAADVTEPRSGARFADSENGLTLLGVGLRTRTFLKVKVYAIGLYVDQAALAGPLATHAAGSAGFYGTLASGDFPAAIRMKFLRDLSADQIQGAFRDSLRGADPAKVDAFVAYFGPLKSGQDVVLHRLPGGTLETDVAGAAKPPISDPRFTAAVFAIWLGDRPVQDDIKKDLVARAPAPSSK